MILEWAIWVGFYSILKANAFVRPFLPARAYIASISIQWHRCRAKPNGITHIAADHSNASEDAIKKNHYHLETTWGTY